MEENTFSLKDVIDVLKRRKEAYILPFLLVLGIAVVLAFLLPSKYQSTSTILIEQREIPAEYVTSSITTYAEQRMQSIHARILTATRLLELIEEFDLYADLRQKKTKDELIEMMREDILLEPVNVEIADRRSGKTGTATIAFTLSFEGKNPAKVQQVTSKITSLFLAEDLKVRKEQSSSAYDFLSSESDKVKEGIDALEKKIAQFKEQNMTTLPELLQLNQQTLDKAERDIEYSKESLRNLTQQRDEIESQLANTPVYIEDTPAVKQQKLQNEQRLEALKLQLINLKSKYSDLYPDVIKIKKEIEDVTREVEASKQDDSGKQKNPAYITLSSRLAGIKSDINSTINSIASQEAKVEDYRLRVAKTPGVEEEYNDLLGERATLHNKYRELQAKMMEAKVARELESEQKGERFTLVEAARLPEKPSKPNRLAIALIGLVLGVGAGVGMAALAEMSDSSFRKADALSRMSGFPVLAEIPVLVTREDIAKQRVKRILTVLVVVVVIVLAVFLFDQFVMDLDVFWAKFSRKYL